MNSNYVNHNHDYCKQLVQDRVGLTQRPCADYDKGGDISPPFQTNEFVTTADLVTVCCFSEE